MTVYLKWGGVYQTGSNGNIKIKWNGVWNTASYVYIKSGGAWRDSGYRGYPLAPQNLWVHYWDFNNVQLNWNGPPAGGAPAVSYQVAMRDSNGNTVGQPDYDNVQPPWGNFGVGQDGYYQFYVRSKSAAGLYSGWTGPVRVKIGHTEQGYDATENRTRSWTSDHASGWRNKDDPFWAGTPTSVVIQAMRWRNMMTPQSGIVTPYNQRRVNWVLPWASGEININTGTVYSGHNLDMALNNQGNGGPWGMAARGTGWSTTSNTYYMLWVDDFWMEGTETYQVTVHYITRNYEGNSYW